MSVTHELPTADATLGSALRACWPLEPGIRFLNHGAYGAAPHPVLSQQDRLKNAFGT